MAIVPSSIVDDFMKAWARLAAKHGDGGQHHHFGHHHKREGFDFDGQQRAVDDGPPFCRGSHPATEPEILLFEPVHCTMQPLTICFLLNFDVFLQFRIFGGLFCGVWF